MSDKKHWMQNMDLKKGALHKELGVPKDKKIPLSKLEKAKHSGSAKERKRATLAETFRKASHSKKA